VIRTVARILELSLDDDMQSIFRSGNKKNLPKSSNTDKCRRKTLNTKDRSRSKNTGQEKTTERGARKEKGVNFHVDTSQKDRWLPRPEKLTSQLKMDRKSAFWQWQKPKITREKGGKTRLQ